MYGYKAKGCDDSLTARSMGRSSTNLFLMETLSTKVMKEMAALNASVHTCSGEAQLIELPTCNAMHITQSVMYICVVHARAYQNTKLLMHINFRFWPKTMDYSEAF